MALAALGTVTVALLVRGRRSVQRRLDAGSVSRSWLAGVDREPLE
jgi:hypothetical protein